MANRNSISRRSFLWTTALGTGAMTSAMTKASNSTFKSPNILILFSDQLGLDAVRTHGCRYVNTPNIDRLAASGVTFIESHSTNPVCSPARSSVFTGRMPTETGVISNGRPIHKSVPNMGQWFGQAGYETVYCGKWHLPIGYQTAINGFTVLPVGPGQGDLVDACASRSCEAFLKTRSKDRPFLLVASFMQPHDICYWHINGDSFVPQDLPFDHLGDELPELPPNHRSRPPAPETLANKAYKGFNDAQWRYYLYVYYRQVEMLDREIGRILRALEDSGEIENTVVLFTADHGSGRGRHMHTTKWFPYEEAVKVPMIVSAPGRIAVGMRDTAHLVTGLDVMPTVCDFAGIDAPHGVKGRSLLPLCEQRDIPWREYVVAETHIIGRTVRTDRFKYVKYQDDPVEQLFDMKEDPWETVNLYDDSKFADVIEAHRKLLEEWENRLDLVPPSPVAGRDRRPRGSKRT